MIEKTVIQYLSEVQTVPVYAEVPTEPPTEFIVVEKTSGGRNNHINDSSIAIQSYSNTMLGAADLNELMKGYMLSLVSLSEVSRVILNSDYNYTDTSTKRYRYQAVYDIVHY